MHSRWYMTPEEKRPFKPTRFTILIDYLVLTAGVTLTIVKVYLLLRYIASAFTHFGVL